MLNARIYAQIAPECLARIDIPPVLFRTPCPWASPCRPILPPNNVPQLQAAVDRVSHNMISNSRTRIHMLSTFAQF